MSLNKAKRVLRALVALCLIDLIIPESHAAKSQKKMRVEWKDAGLWNYFSQIAAESLQDNHTAMNLFLTQELRFQQTTYKFPTQWTYYQSHNGANLPWIFRQGKHALSLMYVPGENPSPYQYRALKQFVERDKDRYGIIFGAEKAPFTQLDRRILLMPFTAVP